MELRNKETVAYYSALTLLFSYAEMLLPRIVPFFRLGFGNIVILNAFDFSFPSFFLLTVFKSIASSFFNGTLFSPFFLISFFQSVVSGFLMYFLFRVKGKWLSLYGISFVGSAVSSVIQIFVSSLYLGKGTFALLGPMLIFSLVSGFITAFIAQKIKLSSQSPDFNVSELQENDKNYVILQFVFILSIVISAFFILIMKNIHVLFAALIFAFIFQLISGRKIKLLPHVFLWIFIFAVSLFEGSGKIIFKIGFFILTEGGIVEALKKSLKLSSLIALSQVCTILKFSEKSFFGMMILYSNCLIEKFLASSGNIAEKITSVLSATSFTVNKKLSQKNRLPLFILIFAVYTFLFIYDFYGFKIF